MNAPRVGNAQSALNKLRQAELDSRRRATTILSPGEVLAGVSPGRVLTTTLGGMLRPITPEDLPKFRASIAQLGTKARAGLTAAEALQLSRPADIERARTEITYSMPTRMQAGHVAFVTNTGPHSKVTRHFVNVEFSGFSAALARPGTASQCALWLVKESPLRFECSCPHWRYFLRYVATIGGWGAGRAEHGFPKIRNPGLVGVCCKHAARVLVDCTSSIGLRQRIAAMVQAERDRIDRPGKVKPKAFNIAQAEAERMLPESARRIVIQQRSVAPPRRATADAIQRAMRELKARPDSGVLLAALENMLRAQRPGTT